MSLAFPRARRLTHQSDYHYVFSAPEHRSSDRYFTVLGRCSLSPDRARLGLVVAKKRVLRAHERNRIKRLVRESFRQQCLFEALDVVVLAKHQAQFATNEQLFASLDKHWQRLAR